MEDEEATAFIQEVYTRVTPTMEKILSGDDDDKLHMEILEANNAIASWQQSHPDKDDMVNLIDIKRIEEGYCGQGPFPGCKVSKRSHKRKSQRTVSYLSAGTRRAGRGELLS